MGRTTEIAGMKKPVCAGCFEYPENCIGCQWEKCAVCKEEFYEGEMYEYRGMLSCEKDHEAMIKKRDFERAEVIAENQHQTKPFRGLDMANDSVIGKANRQILKKEIDIAKKETYRTRQYERPKKAKGEIK